MDRDRELRRIPWIACWGRMYCFLKQRIIFVNVINLILCAYLILIPKLKGTYTIKKKNIIVQISFNNFNKARSSSVPSFTLSTTYFYVHAQFHFIIFHLEHRYIINLAKNRTNNKRSNKYPREGVVRVNENWTRKKKRKKREKIQEAGSKTRNQAELLFQWAGGPHKTYSDTVRRAPEGTVWYISSQQFLFTSRPPSL